MAALLALQVLGPARSESRYLVHSERKRHHHSSEEESGRGRREEDWRPEISALILCLLAGRPSRCLPDGPLPAR